MVKFRILPLLALVSAAALPAAADVALPALLSNHAVLQKSAQTRVWGKADPGEEVAVTLDAPRPKPRRERTASGPWNSI